MAVWPSPVGKGDLLLRVGEDDQTIADLAIGDSVIVSVDHADECEFADNPMPSVTLTAGFIATPLSCDDASNAISGSRCIFRITNLSGTGNLGYGGGNPDCIYSWSRVGLKA